MADVQTELRRALSYVADAVAAKLAGARVVPAESAPQVPPLVSVVIPCYNYGHFLPACVGSVLAQTDVRVELIVIDDASPDGSGEVAERLAAQDPRITVIRHSNNAGHIATYNEGLGAASGEYIVLLSADDLLTPGALSRATALLESHTSVGFAFGRVIEFFPEHVPLPPAHTTPRAWVLWPGAQWLTHRFETSRNVIRTCEVVMRASVQREVGGYRPELPQLGDLDMWMRAAAVADVGYVLGADQAYYRLHRNNMHATLHEGRSLTGVLRDLQERRLAFDLLARGDDMLANVKAARQALAREAVTYATRGYRFGMSDHAIADDFMTLVRAVRDRGAVAARRATAEVDELVSFAVATDPEVQSGREWGALVQARGDGSSGTGVQRVPWLLQDGMRRLPSKLRRWPRRRLGS